MLYSNSAKIKLYKIYFFKYTINWSVGGYGNLKYGKKKFQRDKCLRMVQGNRLVNWDMHIEFLSVYITEIIY